MHPRRLPRRPAVTLGLLALGLAGFARCGDPVDPGDVAPPDRPWQLTWSDEFDGAAGTLPDPSRWGFDVGGHGWGNNQLEYDTARAENVRHDGAGHLEIVARKERYEVEGRAWSYTSARILTRGKFSQAFGRFEARIRLPRGRGIWPAFWLLGDDLGQVGWPRCGEIDVMEYLGHDPATVYGTVHGPGFSGGEAIGDRFSLAGGTFDADFHVFAAEWDPGLIRFFVDDQLYHTVTRRTVERAGGEWVFDGPFFAILNVAVGGNWPGAPDASTVFPQTMTVDWVRVYERAP